MLIMRVDVTDDISPEVDEVTAEFGNGVVQFPKADRIPYEYKIVSCETGAAPAPGGPSVPSPLPTPAPAASSPMPSPAPQPTLAPTAAPTQAPAGPPSLAPTQAPTPSPRPAPTPVPAPGGNPPAPSGACVTEDDCSKNSLCSADFGVYCGASASTCPKPYCKRASSLPPPCVAEDDCSKNSLCSGNWGAYCAALAAACPAPYCKRAAASLAEQTPASTPRRLRSAAARVLQPGLGNSFIQRGDKLHARGVVWNEEAVRDLEPQRDALLDGAPPHAEL